METILPVSGFWLVLVLAYLKWRLTKLYIRRLRRCCRLDSRRTLNRSSIRLSPLATPAFRSPCLG